MGVLDNARAHFASIGLRHKDVPEWGERDAEGKVVKPLRVFWYPMTLAEKQKARTLAESEGRVLSLADVLLMKALGEDGKPMFTLDDKHFLRHKVHPDVLADLVIEIMSTPTAEDAAKNSPGIPSSS